MTNQSYPKLNLYTKNQLANAIKGAGLSFNDALDLINDCLKNKNNYWSDNIKESKPEDGKWVRSASHTKLGQLQKRISQYILGAHDNELPPFIHGGVSHKGVKSAAMALQGKKNRRTLLKLDLRRFFEHVSYNDIVGTLVRKCNCSKEIAQIIAEIACVEEGAKSPSNHNPKVLARGFSTSSRLAIWCNLSMFRGIFNLTKKYINKEHDSRVAFYVDDIGITASRVDPRTMSHLCRNILSLFEQGQTKLEINQRKIKLIDYLQHEYDAITGQLKEGVVTPFEFVGIGIGRSHLFPGIKTRSKISRTLSKPTLTERERRSLKGQKSFARYITTKAATNSHHNR